MSVADSQVRVKVYFLEDGSNWADRGTGFCTLEDCQGELHLSVVSESEPNRAILDCVVQRGEVYQQQESTLIVWTEPTGEDLALSFQEQEGCLSILSQIAEFESATNEHALDRSPVVCEAILPLPTLNSLGEIDRLIGEASQSLFQRDRLVAFILKDAYLSQLQSVHETCEDLEATEELHTIYSIARRIVSLNDSSMFEHIVRDENIVGFIGMLEYNPKNPVEQGAYRDFLRSGSRYKEAVPIGDAATENKIHQNFRLQYLKDVVLPGVLDEGTIPAVSALIFYNNAQIASYLQNNESLLKDLFETLHESSDAEKKRNVVMFVRQLSAMTKTLPAVYRVGLYRTLSQHGLFYVFEYALQEADQSLQVAAADVLLSVLEQDRALVRSYTLAQMRQDREGATLLGLIIRGSKRAIGSEIQLLCCELLRILLDTMPPPADAFDMANIGPGNQANSESEDFLAMFYELYVYSTMECLLKVTSKDLDALGTRDKRSALYLFLCELLSLMMRFHGYRARNFIISSGMFDRVCLFLSAKHSFLKLAALRFFRVCIGLQDDVYNKYLTGNNLLAPVVELLASIYPRDNLLTSACRDLFAIVADNRVLSLLSHLLGAHGQTLERIPCVLEALRLAYNGHLDSLEQAKNGGMATPTVDACRRNALSINMLVGRESASRGALSTLNSYGGGPWSSHAVDDIEDAYLEAEEGDGDFADDDEELAKVPSKIARRVRTGEGGRMRYIEKSPPELEVLQDCLENYSGGESKTLLADDLVFRKRSEHGSSSPSCLSMDEDTYMPVAVDHSSNESAGALLQTRSDSLGTAPPLNRHGSANNGLDSLGSSDGTTKGALDHAGMVSSHVSVSEAFPERRPISRRLSSKRQTLGRIGAAPYRRTTSSPASPTVTYHQSNGGGAANKQPKNGSMDHRVAGDVARSPLSLDRRAKSTGGTKRNGMAGETGSRPQAERPDLQMAHAKQHHSRYTNGGTGNNDRIFVERRSEEIASMRRSSMSCSQGSSPISLLSGSPTEASSPPKKTKTASL
ncbi:Platinum sensitivity protein [Coemansia sp. RSA 2050]|nr:Platinum sensitivity protein [Coemansia sp. RSA 2050]KAJ2731669.1 Platinum sensitivity protein [Coemansia sp. BCRC 34962]